MGFRKLERQPSPARTPVNSVRLFHVSKQGPMIVIPAEVGRVAGIEYGARIDLMIDSDVIPPRVAVVSGGDDLKVLRHGTSGSTLMVSGSRLKGFVPRMKTTVVGYEISSVDGRPSLIITLPLDVSKVKKATP